MVDVFAFTCVRNEEKNITTVIDHLQKQTLPIKKIVVVNDGSEDKTSEIARKLGLQVIDLPNEHKDKRASPELSKLRNAGLAEIDREYDYVLPFGGDHVFPPDYVEKITKEMDSNPKLGVCSGIIKGQGEKRKDLPGSGIIIRFLILKEMNLKFPLKYGSESYLLFKSNQLGYENKILNVESKLLRQTRSTYTKNQYLGYGKAAKALGYTRLFFFGKLIIQCRKSIKGAYYQLCGYLDSNVELHENEIREIVRQKQNRRIKQIIKNLFGFSKS